MGKQQHVLKTLLIGEGAVGKTSLTERYVNARFQDDYKMTVGVGIYSKLVDVDKETECKVVISDIAGQPRFGDIRNAFYTGSMLVMLVFDVTRPATLAVFDEQWLPALLKANPLDPKLPKIQVIIVGNKADLKDERMITARKAQGVKATLQKKYEDRLDFLEYIETSAKENLNVNEAFTTLVKGYLAAMHNKSSH